jgi:hypothetical protein
MSFEIMQNLRRQSLIITNKEPNNALPVHPNIERHIAKGIISSCYPIRLKVRGQ